MARRTTSGPPDALDASMPAIEGFRVVLAGLADEIDANLRGALDHSDPERLHDLRVALRRTRSVIGQGKRVLPPEVVASARPVFARLATLTGPARDLDVLTEQWPRHTDGFDLATLAALSPVAAAIAGRRASAHAALDAGLRSSETAYQLAWWRATLNDIAAVEPAGDLAAQPLGRFVTRRITLAHRRVIDLGRRIDASSSPADVHELRKRAKKLRYLVECFAPLLRERSARRFTTRLRLLQDSLGAHQDAAVHTAIYRSIAVDGSDTDPTTEELLAIGRLIERLDQLQTTTRHELVERFASFDRRRVRDELADMFERA